MADNSAQEKTEKPTPKRRSEARERGQVAKSTELSSFGVLTAGLLCMWLLGGTIFTQITSMLSTSLNSVAETRLNIADVQNISVNTMGNFFKIIFPFLAATAVMAIIMNIAQTGFMIATQRIKPDLKKMNPIQGLKKFVSMRMLVDILKNTGKIVFVGMIAYLVLVDEVKNFPNLGKLGSLAATLLYILNICMRIFMWGVFALLILAIADYAYQKYDFEKNLKMSKQEIKDEFKQTEGDPQVKGRIRQMQREAAQKRMMTSVPEADVVITNPTHLAIALVYKAGEMDAPQVLAKGQNKVAEKIKQIAEENQVPIVEDKPLAQALYKAVEVGQSIPYEMFEAVASLLAHVYRQQKVDKSILDAINN